MTTIRDRIIRAGWEQGCKLRQRNGDPNPRYPESENDTTILIAAACEGLRHAKERADMAWGDCGRGCEAKYIFKAINQLLTEIETGSREDKNDLGGPSPTEAAGTGARVPTPELSHEVTPSGSNEVERARDVLNDRIIGLVMDVQHALVNRRPVARDYVPGGIDEAVDALIAAVRAEGNHERR